MRDLRNQCVAKANDFYTDISVTVAATANELCSGVSAKVAGTASGALEQCRGAAADLRRLGNIMSGAFLFGIIALVKALGRNCSVLREPRTL